jgi:hypothetical protein
MLTFLLVWTVTLGSLTILGAGMVFPEISRKNDLIWVGVGLFYALVLWVNTGNIGGGLLLGQTAGISMMIWLGWQTLTQRRELTAPDKKTPVPDWLQKIVDIVTPLWHQAYGFVTAQIGLEEGTEGQTPADSNDSQLDLKAKFFGFLDKLNHQPQDVAGEDSSVEEEDELTLDASEDIEDAVESEATNVEAVPDIETSPTENLAPPAESESFVETAPLEQPSIADVTDEQIEGEMSGGSLEMPEPQDPEPEVVVAVEEIQVEPVAVMPEHSDQSSTDAPDDQANSDQANSDQANSDQANSIEESTPSVEISPESLGGAVDQNDVSDAPENDAAIAEDSVQEDSNWPPDPIN